MKRYSYLLLSVVIFALVSLSIAEARYYNPQTGRYLRPDPTGLAGGINLYGYAAQNPINYIDPLGLAYSPYGEHGRGWGLPGSEEPPDLEDLQTSLEIGGTVDPTPLLDSTNALIYALRGEWGDACLSGISTIPYVGDAIGKGGKLASRIGKNAKKLSIDEIGDFLGAGKNWHEGKAKKKFLNKFKKELKGDTNADFYVDKKTKEILLKSNKNKNWVRTGEYLE